MKTIDCRSSRRRWRRSSEQLNNGNSTFSPKSSDAKSTVGRLLSEERFSLSCERTTHLNSARATGLASCMATGRRLTSGRFNNICNDIIRVVRSMADFVSAEESALSTRYRLHTLAVPSLPSRPRPLGRRFSTRPNSGHTMSTR